MKIKYYHFHLYYPVTNIEEASALREKISSEFDFEVGRLWDKPVGPHPIGSCQVSVPTGRFEEALTWCLANRGGVDFFIHPVTGDDLADHSDHALWLGKSYELKIDGFKAK
jgi:DOPA 4,5-dioxygenase